MTEDQVIDSLLRYLPSRGHEILGFAKGNKPGWDIATLYRGALFAIEAKGISSFVPPHKRVARSELIWDSGFARLVQIASGRKHVYRVEPDGRRVRTERREPAYVCLAVPDTGAFRSQFEWFRQHMETCGFGAWFVKQSCVNPVLMPRRIR